MNRLLLLLSNTLLVLLEVIVLTFFASIFFKKNLSTVKFLIELDRALKMLNVAKLTERQCQNCWAFRYCTNCISHCDDGKDVNAKLRTMQCQKSRGNVYYTFRIMILLLNKKSLTLYRKESQ